MTTELTDEQCDALVPAEYGEHWRRGQPWIRYLIRAGYRAALAAPQAPDPAASKCSPTLTECPRCKNDIKKCDGLFLPPADWSDGPLSKPNPPTAWDLQSAGKPPTSGVNTPAPAAPPVEPMAWMVYVHTVEHEYRVFTERGRAEDCADDCGGEVLPLFLKPTPAAAPPVALVEELERVALLGNIFERDLLLYKDVIIAALSHPAAEAPAAKESPDPSAWCDRCEAWVCGHAPASSAPAAPPVALVEALRYLRQHAISHDPTKRPMRSHCNICESDWGGDDAEYHGAGCPFASQPAAEPVAWQRVDCACPARVCPPNTQHADYCPVLPLVGKWWLYSNQKEGKCIALDHKDPHCTPDFGWTETQPAAEAPAAPVAQAPGPSDGDGPVFFYERDFYVLSNFSAFRLQWNGSTYDTSEHAYHAMKFPDFPDIQHRIYRAPSAHEAFKIAEQQRAHRRADWDDIKIGVMREMLLAKAMQHEYVRRKLLATGDRLLVEDSWRDDYWGWGPNRDGQNMLGKLWMEVRAALRAASPAPADESWRGCSCGSPNGILHDVGCYMYRDPAPAAGRSK